MNVARMLINKEADPEAKAKNGLTSLHVATHYNKEDVVRLLLRHKANPDTPARVRIIVIY